VLKIRNVLFFLKPLFFSKRVLLFLPFFFYYKGEFCGYTFVVVSFLISQHYLIKEGEKSLPAKSLSHLSMSLFPISRKSDEYEFFVD